MTIEQRISLKALVEKKCSVSCRVERNKIQVVQQENDTPQS